MVVTYTLASWARAFCTAAAFKQASGLQQKMAASEQTYGKKTSNLVEKPKWRIKLSDGVSNHRGFAPSGVAAVAKGRSHRPILGDGGGSSGRGRRRRVHALAAREMARRPAKGARGGLAYWVPGGLLFHALFFIIII